MAKENWSEEELLERLRANPHLRVADSLVAPQSQSQASIPRDAALVAPPNLSTPPAKARRAKQPNKTELEYARHYLEPRLRRGEIVSYVWEAVRVKLADGCTYSIDWFVTLPDRTHEAHEVKGAHSWDDAVVKFKVARAQFPFWTFYWARKRKGNWQVVKWVEGLS